MEDEGARTSDEAAFNRSLALLRHHLAVLGAPQPVYTPYVPMRFEDQVRVLLDAHVPVFSFIYGIPPREILDDSDMPVAVRGPRVHGDRVPHAATFF